MAQKSETHKRIIRSTIFIVIIILGITGINIRNKNFENTEALFITADINVFVIEKPLNGLTNNLICENYFIEMMERQIIEDLDKRLSTSHIPLNKISSHQSAKADSWCQSKGGNNFIIIKQKYKDSINSTSIVGFKGSSIIYITGYSAGCDVPYTYGPCAKRMEAIFGFSLKKRSKQNSIS